MAVLNINTGINPNDGLGDSIRDAFVKVNSNFDALEAARVEFGSNLVTGNLEATTSFTANGTGDLTGFFTYNGIEIATVGTTFSGGFVANPTEFQSTQDSTANLALGGVLVDGGLVVKKTTRANLVFANTVTVTNLTTSGSFYTTGNANVGNVNSTGQGIYAGNIRSTNGQLIIAGNITGGANLLVTSGNIWAGNLNVTNYINIGSHMTSSGNFTTTGDISGNYITGTLTTAIQTAITRVGTLSNLSIATNLTVSDTTTTTNLVGTLGTFDRMIVNNLPISSKDATNRDYVDIQVVAYGIALG